MSKLKIAQLLLLFIFAYGHLFASNSVKLGPKIREVKISDKQKLQENLKNWQEQFVDIQILSEKQAKLSPRVIANKSGKVLSVDNDKVYVDNLAEVDYKKSLAVYRLGDPIKNKNTKDTVAYTFYYLGDATLEQYDVDNNLSLLSLSSVNKEVLAGDRILNKQRINTLKIQKNIDKNLEGTILSIVNGVKNADNGQSIILNLGKINNIVEGNLLQVVKQPSTKRSVRYHEDTIYERDNYFNKKRDPNKAKTISLPAEKIATILVYRVFDNTSVGLVIDSKEPVSVAQKVTTG